MASSREDIAASLTAYRSFIAAQNRRVLEVYVPFIATAVPDDLDGDEDIKELRLEGLNMLLDTTLQGFDVSEPSEVLTRYDELAPKIGLDGTYVLHEGTPDEHEAARRAYLSVIEENLKKKSREDVAETISIPEDFRVLAGLVDGIVGYGLPVFRNETQPAFWWGCRDDQGPHAETVMTPEALTEHANLPECWQIAGGWAPGTGPDANFSIVYSRESDEDAWKWRYTLSTAEDGLQIFETIPEFLAWYTHFGECDEMPGPNELNVDRLLFSTL
ncbi:hypothetical protein CORC01_01357 [Colletotrichum orchidophilum]|uniref:Uncharacterized protein n=1 Tax=Colletotrichum orchidophilum TaxID=1209926 RepID=A0A1G4BPF9_9PEZI|nr:uncharacterized protein CORC01_01357 [Colletotrichum orchidophilum]OHF03304.1 hypothetical protein CORC01_01357 [Colletotrichum orchidophilum]